MQNLRLLFYFTLTILFFGPFSELRSQNNKVDSLELRLKTEKNDSIRADLYVNIASLSTDSAKKFSYTEIALKIGTKNQLKKTIENVYKVRGQYYYDQSKFAAAVENWLLCLNESQVANDTAMQIRVYQKLGNVFKDFGNFPVAFSYYSKEKKLSEIRSDSTRLEVIYESLGALYNDLTDKSDSAKYYFDHAIRLCILLHGNPSLEYINLAEWFKDNKQYENALRTYHLSDSCYALRSSEYAAYGHLWVEMGRGDVFRDEGKFQDALDNFKIVYDFAKKNKDEELLDHILFPIYDAENKLGHKPEALKYLQEYVAFNDSIKGENNSRQIMIAQSQFEIQQKDKLNRLEKEKKEAEHNAELSQQRLFLWGTIAVLSIVLIILVFIYRSYKINKRAKEAISMQKQIVDEKQKEILDSIHYAKRIQHAMMPTEKYIDRSLKKLRDKK